MNKTKLLNTMFRFGVGLVTIAIFILAVLGVIYAAENNLREAIAVPFLFGFVCIVIPLVYFYGKEI